MSLFCRIFLLIVICISVPYAKYELLQLPLHHFEVDSTTLQEANELLRKSLIKSFFGLGIVLLLNKSKYQCVNITCAKKWGEIFGVDWVFFPKILRAHREWLIQVTIVDMSKNINYTRTIPIPYGIYKLEDISTPLTRHFVYRIINKNDWKNNEWVDSVEVLLSDSLMATFPKESVLFNDSSRSAETQQDTLAKDTLAKDTLANITKDSLRNKSSTSIDGTLNDSKKE